MIEDFVPKINLKDSTIVSNYGAGAQKKVADFSDSMLSSVKTKDLGEVGEMLANVVTELKGFEEEEEQKGIFGFFKKQSNKLEAMKTRYNKAEANIDQIVKALEGHQIQLLKDSAMLDKMYEMNLAYYKELCLYIMAGKIKLKQVQEGELKELTAKAQQTGAAEDAQAANDLSNLCNRFEKKLHDLDLTRMISIQMGPQIRLIQNNDTLMVDKIQSTLVNTIPLWKSQMVLALGVTHSQQAAAAQRGVTELTNQMLRKNAETLKMATIDTAKESERGIVDIETLRATNENPHLDAGRGHADPAGRPPEAGRGGDRAAPAGGRPQAEASLYPAVRPAGYTSRMGGTCPLTNFPDYGIVKRYPDTEIRFEVEGSAIRMKSVYSRTLPGCGCLSFCRRRIFFGGVLMETRIAVIGIVVSNTDAVEELNEILHEYRGFIIGRMGIPYRQKKMNIISIAVDAPQDVISALSGKIGKLPGVSSKTAYAGG